MASKKKSTVIESGPIANEIGQEKKATKAVKLGKDKKLKADGGGTVVFGESVFSEKTWGKLKEKNGDEKELLKKLKATDGRSKA